MDPFITRLNDYGFIYVSIHLPDVYCLTTPGLLDELSFKENFRDSFGCDFDVTISNFTLFKKKINLPETCDHFSSLFQQFASIEVDHHCHNVFLKAQLELPHQLEKCKLFIDENPSVFENFKERLKFKSLFVPIEHTKIIIDEFLLVIHQLNHNETLKKSFQQIANELYTAYAQTFAGKVENKF